MNLKLLNVAAVSLVGAALTERGRRRTFLGLVLAAAVLDLLMLGHLMLFRPVAERASAGLAPVQMLHVVVSGIFPVLYPLLVVAAFDALPDRRRGDRPVVDTRLLLAFALLRFASFATSYLMVE